MVSFNWGGESSKLLQDCVAFFSPHTLRRILCLPWSMNMKMSWECWENWKISPISITRLGLSFWPFGKSLPINCIFSSRPWNLIAFVLNFLASMWVHLQKLQVSIQIPLNGPQVALKYEENYLQSRAQSFYYYWRRHYEKVNPFRFWNQNLNLLKSWWKISEFEWIWCCMRINKTYPISSLRMYI